MKIKTQKHYITSFFKLMIYIRIALHVAFYYLFRIKRHFHGSPIKYIRFLFRALRLLLIFRFNKVVKTSKGYKLHLYLPAYPSRAFFYAIESKLIREPARPTTIVFSMTKACDFKCPHCYQRKDKGADLDETTMIKVAKEMLDLGVAMFDIEGGEPALRLPRLSKLIQNLDERAEIWVNTHGLHFTKEHLLALKNLGLYGIMVSVHSPQRSKHDQFTGVLGSFDAAKAVLIAARSLSLATTINSVLSEDEIKEGHLNDLMELAKELDCDYVQLIHPKASGKWLGKHEKMQKEHQILNRISNAHRYYNGPKTKDYPSLSAQVFEESPCVLGCTAGAVDRFYLNANGELQPCEFLNISFGNVKEEPFKIIYNRMRSYFQKPCSNWLCCTQADAIYELMQKHGLTQTPIPWPITRELTEHWDRGKPTPIYKKLGIYK